MSTSVPPNLTEHFKQALNMTRSQFQSGSTPLNSATQMGVQQLNSFGSGSSSGPGSGPGGLNSKLNTTEFIPENFNNHDMGKSISIVQPESNFLVDFYNNYNKVILIGFIILIGCYAGYVYWWRPKYGYGNSNNDNLNVEEMTNGIANTENTIHRRPHDPNSHKLKRVLNYNPQLQPQNQPQLQSQFQPQLQSQLQSQPQPLNDNIRLNEQQMAMRGAEFANPQLVSQMMPVSTRLTQSTQQVVSPQQPPVPQQVPQQVHQQVPQQIHQQVPQQVSQSVIPPPQINVVSQPVSNDKIQLTDVNPIQTLPISDPNYTAI
jgi:hypothetical protein